MIYLNIFHTESIAFSNTGLTGPIPTTLTNLQSLEVFKVENCNLFGDGYMSLYDIPTLKVLGVAGNKFLTGTLDGIGKLAKLEELYLGNTKMGGPLPEELGQLSNLWIITSPETAFTGAIPASWGNLKSLKELDFSQNQLTGALATELGQLTKLETVNLYENGEYSLSVCVSIISLSKRN